MENDEKITPETLKEFGFKVWGEDSPNLYNMGSGFDSVYYFIDSKLLIVKKMESGQKRFDNIITVGALRKILDKNW